jgi:hypothetical protein
MKEKIGFGLFWVGIGVYLAIAFLFPLVGHDWLLFGHDA